MRYAPRMTLMSAAFMLLVAPYTHANSPATPDTARIKPLDAPAEQAKNLDGEEPGSRVTPDLALPVAAGTSAEPLSLAGFLKTLKGDSDAPAQLKARMPFLPGMAAHSGDWNLALAPKNIQDAVAEGLISEDQARFSFEQQKSFYEWTQRNPSRRYLFVNVPTYDLHFYEGMTNASLPIEHYRLDWQSDSIVGRPTHPSPDQSLDIISIKYNPTWTPTQNMMNRNAVLDDGSWNWEWIDQHNFLPYSHETGELLTWAQATQLPLDAFFFVEPAGPQNTLGQIKFETNSQNYIYLHDTNTPWYFERKHRAISSGCVRVKKPLELAAKLLDKDIPHVERQLSTLTTHWERIERTPFYFMYDIVEYDDQGQVVGAGDDPYGWYADWLAPDEKAVETVDMDGLDYEIKEL